MNEKIKQQIKQTLRETSVKRYSQRCKTFILKIDESSLNKKEKEQLKMFFIEAKWLYNNVLASKDPFHYNYKTTTVTIFDKNKQPQTRTLQLLSLRLRYDIIKHARQNITSLAKLKKKNVKVGQIKFKSNCTFIDLYRYKITHRITGHNRIKIAGIKRHLVVRGLKQIKEHYELANAKLLKKPSGYYIALTCYEFIKPEMLPKLTKEVGLDFGIKNNITTSDGEVFNVRVEETERLKRLQQKWRRQVKNSNNFYKTKLLIAKEYEHITNKRHDKANKIVNYLLTNFAFVYIQDDNVKNWQKNKRFSKQIQRSCIGNIKSKLKQSKSVKIIDRYYPSTKLCYQCGRINKLSLNDRVYNCECGLVEDRDVKAAKTIMYVGKCQSSYIPMENRKFKPVEKKTSDLQVSELVH